MAKYARHDPRNRKINKNKNESKRGRELRQSNEMKTWKRNNLKAKINQLAADLDFEAT